MTVRAYIRNRSHGDVREHDCRVHEPAGAPAEPTIVDAPGFGLYAVGVHPEYGPMARYVIGTPGTEPEFAPCNLVDGRLEVPLLRDDVLTLVIEGHPMHDEGTQDEQQQRAALPVDGGGAGGPQADRDAE